MKIKSLILIFLGFHVSLFAQTLLERNKEVARYFMEEAMGTPQYLDLHTSDFIAHAGSSSYTLDEDYAASLDNKKGFPDLKVKVTRMVAEENFVVTHWKASGTNTGSNSFIPTATNKYAEIEGITIFRMEEGKIAEEWGLTNLLPLLLKWGVLKTQ